MATFTADFQGDDLATLGAAWREYNVGWHRDSGAAVPDATGYCVAQYATDAATGSQFSRMQVGSTWGGGRVGPCIFMPTIGGTNVETGVFYMFVLTGTGGNTAVLQRKLPNSATFVTIKSVTLSEPAGKPGTTLNAVGWVDGTSLELRGFVNSTEVISARVDNVATDVLAQRRVGMYASGPNAPLLRVASWTGGDRADVTTTLPPPVPTGLNVNTPEPLMALLQWNATVGATAYELVWQSGGIPADGSRQADGSVTPSEPLDPAKWQLLTRTSNTNYSHTNLTEGVLYTYAVRAVNAAGMSALSEPVSILPYFVRGTPWKVWINGQKVPAFLRGIWIDGQIVPVARHYIYRRPEPTPVTNPTVTVTTTRSAQTVSITVGVVAGTGAIDDVTVDPGDGSAPIVDTTAPYTASRTYVVPNDTTSSFTVTATARAVDGGIGMAAATVSVPGPITPVVGVTNPTVSFTLSRVDQTVTMNAAATTVGSAPIARHETTWGDNTATTTSTEPDRVDEHSYVPPPEGFTYTVTVKAIATDGGTSTASKTINVPAPSGGGGDPVGTVSKPMIAGALTATGFTVTSTTTGGAQVRLVASTTSTFSSVVRGPAATPDSAGYVKASITGLQPGTVYYYALELGGGIYKARTQKLKTAPSGHGSFKFVFASCVGGKKAAIPSSLFYPGMNVAAWTRMKNLNPLFYIMTGDLTYQDNNVANESGYHIQYDYLLNGTTTVPFLQEVPWFYTWSDHDFGPNNSYGMGGAGATVKPFAQSAYRKRFPSPALPSTTGGIYHTFVVGRVRFIMADQRSYKTTVQAGTNMNAGKSMLGAEQKAWIKKVITDSPEKVIFYVSDVFFSNANNDDDGWPAYGLERIEMANFFKESGKIVEIIAGDQHCIAYDDGTNSLDIPVFHGASINSGSSFKTVPLTFGKSETEVGGSNQFGEIEIVDNGGSTITRICRLYESGGTVAFTNSRTITVGAPTGDTTPPTAPTNFAAGTPTATSIPLTWTASTDTGSGVASYTALNNGTVLQGGFTGTSGTLIGLSPSTRYVLTLRSQDAAGNQSPVSNSITVTTPAGGVVDTTPPTAPTNLAAGTATANSIPLTWTASTDNVGVVSYTVYNNGNPMKQGIATNSTTLTGLTQSTTYGPLTVRAFDAAGNISQSSNGISVTTPAGTTTPEPTGRPYIAYTENSWFRRPIPVNAPIASTNAQGISFHKLNDNPYPKIRTKETGWAMGFALAKATDPIWKIGTTGSNFPASQAHLKTSGFHAPADLISRLPGNADNPFVVIDPIGTPARPNGLTVWGYKGAAGGVNIINVTNGGSFSHDTDGIDRKTRGATSPLNERHRGVIPDSMVIRPDLLQWAMDNNTSLGHCLEMFSVETDWRMGHCYPMSWHEGHNDPAKQGFGAEGMRWRIKRSVDVVSRAAGDKVALVILRTLQEHGAYIGDNSGSGSGFKFPSDASFPGMKPDLLAGKFTWDDMEWIAPGYDVDTGNTYMDEWTGLT